MKRRVGTDSTVFRLAGACANKSGRKSARSTRPDLSRPSAVRTEGTGRVQQSLSSWSRRGGVYWSYSHLPRVSSFLTHVYVCYHRLLSTGWAWLSVRLHPECMWTEEAHSVTHIQLNNRLSAKTLTPPSTLKHNRGLVGKPNDWLRAKGLGSIPGEAESRLVLRPTRPHF
jgi:hypothetical protein